MKEQLERMAKAAGMIGDVGRRGEQGQRFLTMYENEAALLSLYRNGEFPQNMFVLLLFYERNKWYCLYYHRVCRKFVFYRNHGQKTSVVVVAYQSS